MAAGFPTKVTYADGDVFAAVDMNDTNGTLNYINPTAATDRQVLTRDNVSPGKLKYADSPANTLTTTGDLYYASAANTPARLPIGTTDQVLKVTSGVPAWGTASAGAMTLIATNTLSSATTTSFSSIPATYKHLKIIGSLYATASNSTVTMDINAGSLSITGHTLTISMTPAVVLAVTTNARVAYSSVGEYCGWDATIFGYTVADNKKLWSSYGSSTGTYTPYIAGGQFTTSTSVGITALSFVFTSSTGTIALYGIS